MTDEARELLAACGIATEDSDDQAEAEQNDRKETTHDEEPGEDTFAWLFVVVLFCFHLVITVFRGDTTGG